MMLGTSLPSPRRGAVEMMDAAAMFRIMERGCGERDWD